MDGLGGFLEVGGRDSRPSLLLEPPSAFVGASQVRSEGIVRRREVDPRTETLAVRVFRLLALVVDPSGRKPPWLPRALRIGKPFVGRGKPFMGKARALDRAQ